jgi:enoyl-[acyl-carrier protein] reductase II
MGTRFLLAEECGVHENVKARLIEAVDTDSVVTGLSIGHGVRGVKNKFTAEFIAAERNGTPEEKLIAMATGTNKLAAIDGDVENGMVQAGQSLLPLKKIEPAKVIIENIIEEAKKTLAAAAAITL